MINTLKDLRDAISSVSTFATKVTYRAWPVGKAPNLPFICYLATDTDNFDADNKTYKVIQNVDVELYTAKKSENTEKALEKVFDDNGIPWDKAEEWLDSENCYEIIYNISI